VVCALTARNRPTNQVSGTTAAKKDKKRHDREAPSHDAENDLGLPELNEGIDVGVFRMVLLVKDRAGVAEPPGGRALGDIGGHGEAPAPSFGVKRKTGNRDLSVGL